MPVSIRVRQNPPDLARTIGEAPRMARGRMTKAAAVYLVGNGRRGLAHYPMYKYVSRRSAYGKTFFSDRQRRYVMAQIKSGRIDPGVPHRTGMLQRGWQVVGDNTKATIVNTEEHADVVMGKGQARLNAKVGWRVYSKVIDDNADGMLKAANDELRAYYKEKGVTVK